ncbi:MAG: DUF6642 family protein [Actinomycetota bacterium]
MSRRKRVPGIFCVEGTWSSKLTDRASVVDMLEILEDVDGIDFIHDRVTTVDGLLDLLKRWKQKQYAPYGLGYFAFHGRPGKIMIGRHVVTLDQIGSVLAGACEGRILYFGSCSVLKLPDEKVEAFRAKTKAECVVGFTREVDWLASAALDLILLQALAYQHPEEVERKLNREYGGLATHLGLKMYFDAVEPEIVERREETRDETAPQQLDIESQLADGVAGQPEVDTQHPEPAPIPAEPATLQPEAAEEEPEAQIDTA